VSGMEHGGTRAERGNYIGWILAGGIILGVFAVAALLWIHYHG
jgi:hypothetical protein